MFKNRKNNKKGFTLVEVIVVIVILAILAAIMIPALTGWIEKANKKTTIVEARSALLALQTEASEDYNTLKSGNVIDLSTTADPGKTIISDAEELAEVKKGSITEVKLEGNCKVKSFTYTGDKYKVTYNSDTKFGEPEKKN